MSEERSLFVFTQDLRLQDNLALNALFVDVLTSESQRKTELPVAFAYVFDERWFKSIRYQQQSMGQHKLAFLLQSLADLQQQLESLGHTLHLCIGDPVTVISDLVQQNSIKTLGYSKQVGWDERQIWQQVAKRQPQLRLISEWNNGLFNQQQITLYVNAMTSFSQFRRKVEKTGLSVEQPCNTFNGISTQSITLISEALTDLSQFQATKSALFSGGEQAAQQHVSHYFSKSYPSEYKQTRNELDGIENSTKFSPFLSMGNISARKIWAQLKQYEQIHGANDSTYWIGFELLWREYFHWLALQHGTQLYRFKGQATKPPLTSFLPERFTKWCLGSTPYPLVNACMKQLNSTGYMSNRGRQIVASCLVNELGVDWHFGAAYFEQQLIDYDVASNWGNWQYIAGVGVDPRGGRHFNIEKQTQQYDPNGDFIARWCSSPNDCSLDITHLDSVDIDDWPIDCELIDCEPIDSKPIDSKLIKHRPIEDVLVDKKSHSKSKLNKRDFHHE
ncbi:hypothetical protein BCU84_05260 [Shewanella sp. 10N.286.51.B7]|uniref:DASH family cryptochrome n=1 Tax=Shewanella sp. 10N.286.51.B7 TaxID=1880836 RepID=UPI000C821DE9|nr:DASH family cryptochrome [Shewanella sp. 10N.286.51.B7]PMG79548.1 hypothetical protein BCU84_05260 [Shewanella sp. 10N.286.51.B7]